MRELLQQALDLLKSAYVSTALIWERHDCVNALEAELAKPEQDHGFDRTGSHMAQEYVDTNQPNKYFPEQYVQKSDESIHEMQRLGQELEQKPVAWMYNGHLHECDPSDWALDDVIPLYTSPPRKEWVGLTDEDHVQLLLDTKDRVGLGLVIEAKLRSKNER